MKPINSHTTNEFHDFNLRRLYGRGCTMQDVDAQVLSINDTPTARVIALLELKRSP